MIKHKVKEKATHIFCVLKTVTEMHFLKMLRKHRQNHLTVTLKLPSNKTVSS